MAVLIAAAIALLIVSVLLLMPIRLYFQYTKDARKNSTEVYLKYLWFRIKMVPRDQKPKKQKKQDKQAQPNEKTSFSFDTFRERFLRYKKIFEVTKDDLLEIFKYSGKHAVSADLVDFDMEYGLEDAMQTGVLMGGICGIVYNVLALADHHISIREKHVDIRPDFHNPCFVVHFQCILRLKNVHIMVIIVKLLKLYLKIKKV